MSANEPDDRTAAEPQSDAGPAVGRPHRDNDLQTPSASERHKRRNPWIWISALLALVAAGLLVWALTAQSDNDSTQQQLASAEQELGSTQDELMSTQQQLDATQDELDNTKQDVAKQQSSDESSGDGRAVLTAGALAAVKTLIDDLQEQLETTQNDLAKAEQDVHEATDKADQATEDAAAAEDRAAQASTGSEKANAEADQAKAEAAAAESRAAIAVDCARAYVAALGQLFESDDTHDQADAVRQQLSGITTECKTAMAE